jgi:hypothetical protein
MPVAVQQPTRFAVGQLLTAIPPIVDAQSVEGTPSIQMPVEPTLHASVVPVPTPVLPPASPPPPADAPQTEHLLLSQLPTAVEAVSQSVVGVHFSAHMMSLQAHAAMQLMKEPQAPPVMSSEANPDPYAVVASEPQLDSMHERQLWSISVIGLDVAHVNFVGVPPLLLLLLHARADAAHASASAVKPRNPIMKGPPEYGRRALDDSSRPLFGRIARKGRVA